MKAMRLSPDTGPKPLDIAMKCLSVEPRGALRTRHMVDRPLRMTWTLNPWSLLRDKLPSKLYISRFYH